MFMGMYIYKYPLWSVCDGELVMVVKIFVGVNGDYASELIIMLVGVVLRVISFCSV